MWAWLQDRRRSTHHMRREWRVGRKCTGMCLWVSIAQSNYSITQCFRRSFRRCRLPKSAINCKRNRHAINERNLLRSCCFIRMLCQLQTWRCITTIMFWRWNLGSWHTDLRRSHLSDSRRQRTSDSWCWQASGWRNRHIFVFQGKIFGWQHHAALLG